MEKFNFDSFYEEQGKINNYLMKSNANFIGAIKTIKENDIEVLSQYVSDLKDKISKITNDINILNKDLEGEKEKNIKLENELNDLHTKLYILRTDNEKLMKLKELTHSQARKHTGDNTNPKYILFYRHFIRQCQGVVIKAMGSPNMGAISVNDFDAAMTVARKWFPTQKLVNEKIREYQKLQDKGMLDSVKSKALDKILEKLNGGLN